MNITKCEVCGQRLDAPAERFAPWAVVACSDTDCQRQVLEIERWNRKEWRDQMTQDQGLPVDEDNSDG